MSYLLYVVFLFFFFKQKTAYGMRIIDWSSDVCSADLMELHPVAVPRQRHIGRMAVHAGGRQHMRAIDRHALRFMDGGGIAVIDMGIIFQVKRDRSAIVQLHRHALRRYLLDLPQRAV